MPPYSHELPDEGGPSSNNNSECPSPTSSCISIDAWQEEQQYKFAHPPELQDDSQRRKVYFDLQSITVRLIEPISEWTDDERQSRWHSQEDYSCFRKDVFHTLFQLRNHPGSVDGILYTARGVECRDPAIVGRRQRVKQAAWQAVFGEQEARRKEEGCSGNANGQDWMATLYSNAAKPSVLEALDLAALDEMEVNEFYKQDQANCDCVVEDFSDDWIRSVSSSCGEQSKNTATKSTTEKEEESGFCVFGDPSGFDDSWLRGD